MNVAKHKNTLILGTLAMVLVALLALQIIPVFTAGSELPAFITASEEPVAVVPFFGVSPEIKADLEQIALADTRIQSLVAGREYEYVIDGNHVVKVKGYDLAVGVRLRNDVTEKQFQDWVAGGRTDMSIVGEYVGCLNVGYNDKYTITIDKSQRCVTNFSLLSSRQFRIPELSKVEMDEALAIVTRDPRIQELLEGRDYVIAPEGGIGVWHTSYEEGKDIQKIGVSLQVEFSKPYQIDYVFPGISPDDAAVEAGQAYQETTYHYSGEVKSLNILVDLGKGKVVSISPISDI